ncbi:hypothetical protein ACJ73_04126 [Blastomyces percursus]|uniref:Uncharacterized protein n=1 Tax=Blastomyces percursus TaxID=1658174 RepID=A0A1J9Q6Z7_9EURO|nr:hypothetical protein ACJ73_04126 [Blastomyces percursus]
MTPQSRETSQDTRPPTHGPHSPEGQPHCHSPEAKEGAHGTPSSSHQGMEALLAKKDEISAILTSAQVEKEERWVTCIVPGLQPEYQDYEGRTQTLTAKQASEEFTRITGVTPQLCRWNRAQPERPSNALVLAFPPGAAARLPKTVEIYGHRRPVIIKPPKAKILQCSRCWSFHPERYCNRNPRCRRCSSRDHQEGHPACHKEDNEDCRCPERCTNCLGTHAANDLSCPARPVVKNAVVQRHPKTRKNDIRKAQNQAYWTKSKDCFCGGRYSALDGRQDASPEGSPSFATAPLSTPNPISSSTTSGTACATSPIILMRKNSSAPKFLQIMQVNIGKGGSAYETALNLAYEEKIDIIVI